jgi:trigger factor
MTDEPQTEEQGTQTTEHQPPADAAQEGVETAVSTEVAEKPTEEEKPGKLQQTVEMHDIGPCKKHIKVTVARGAIDERFKEKFAELGGSANVAGFRPGKAPRKLVERRFQRDVSDQVKTEVLLASLEQLADEQDIAPLSTPNIDPAALEIPKEGDFIYEFDVEVRPEFDLPQYKGLKLRRPVYTSTEEDVVQEKRRLLTPHGQIVPKPEGKAQTGDVLVTDLTFRDGDREISKVPEVQLRVEKQLVFKDAVAPRFAEQVAGVNAGETRTVDLNLSAQAANRDLAGRPIQMVLEVKDVKTVRLPELTHEFLHTFGVHSPEQFDEVAQAVLKRRLEYQQRQSAREQVMQHIASTATWELPRDLLGRQARKSLNRRVMEMRSEGMGEEEIQGRLRLLQQDILLNTEIALKEHFVLQKIAEVEKIEVTEQDVEDEIDRIAERANESPRRVRARLEKEDMIEALAAEMIERKALDLILAFAEYEDVQIGERPQTDVATVEEQAVPGEMQDVEAVTEEEGETQPSAESETPPTTGESPTS